MYVDLAASSIAKHISVKNCGGPVTLKKIVKNFSKIYALFLLGLKKFYAWARVGNEEHVRPDVAKQFIKASSFLYAGTNVLISAVIKSAQRSLPYYVMHSVSRLLLR